MFYHSPLTALSQWKKAHIMSIAKQTSILLTLSVLLLSNTAVTAAPVPPTLPPTLPLGASAILEPNNSQTQSAQSQLDPNSFSPEGKVATFINLINFADNALRAEKPRIDEAARALAIASAMKLEIPANAVAPISAAVAQASGHAASGCASAAGAGGGNGSLAALSDVQASLGAISARPDLASSSSLTEQISSDLSQCNASETAQLAQAPVFSNPTLTAFSVSAFPQGAPAAENLASPE